MTTAIHPRNCRACNKQISGRADKKFCNDYCRNDFNNAQKAGSTNLMRNINNALAKNRRIMQSLFTEDGTHRVTRDRLLLQGFQFKFFTHTFVNRKGSTYFFCYDTGYLPLDNDWFLLVKRKEERE